MPQAARFGSAANLHMSRRNQEVGRHDLYVPADALLMTRGRIGLSTSAAALSILIRMQV